MTRIAVYVLAVIGLGTVTGIVFTATADIIVRVLQWRENRRNTWTRRDERIAYKEYATTPRGGLR